MKIVETYSHFNGLEFLKIHRKKIWEEINSAIHLVDADTCKINDSREENASGYNSIVLNNYFKKLLIDLGWKDNHNDDSIRKTKTKEFRETTSFNSNESNFIKERISLEIQLNNCYYETPILFERHLARYVVDMIDVGISILPMKSLQIQMSSGVPYYEGELYNVIRQGRGVPAVPLVIVGIMP
jgi:hypothetical protein